MFKKKPNSSKKISILFFIIFLMFILSIGFFVNNRKMHKEMACIKDINSYSYQKFYGLVREDRLNFDLMLEYLENKPLVPKDKEKLEKICTYQVEDGMVRLEVAKGYDCLLRLYANEESSLPQLFKAIKNGSYGLDTLYTKNAAINLVKLLILGHEKEVEESLDIKNNDDFLKYFSGYAEDEIPFLNNLIALNIDEITAKSLYRLSLIHSFGRSSFNEQGMKPDYKRAIEEIQKVIKLTGIKQNNVIDIALIINGKFAPHAATVISSSLLNSDLDSFYRFHIVMNPKDALSEESMKKLTSMKYIRDHSIDFIPFPENLLNVDLINKKMRFSDNWPRLVIYRLYFDKIFPNLDSILYLDADIVVLRDLNSFKKIDMSNYVAAGVMDTALTYCALDTNNNCNRNINSSYKNSGVIFFNLHNMRDKQNENMILEAMQKSECEFSFLDQDLLNIAFHNYIYPLAIRWNFCTHFIDRGSYFSNFILHYAGQKPWAVNKKKHKKNSEKYEEIEKYYWRYRELTPWNNQN